MDTGCILRGELEKYERISFPCLLCLSKGDGGHMLKGMSYREQLYKSNNGGSTMSDFTWEVGDVLYGECACTPSKFIVFEVCSEGRIKVVDCWDTKEIGRKQWASSCLDLWEGQTLNDHLHKILGGPYHKYNYIKYTKEEWQKRQRSKFIIPGALIEKQEPTTHTFKKSDYKVTETDKEIRVTPRPKKRHIRLSIGGVVTKDFYVGEDYIELLKEDVEKYRGE